VASSKGLVIPLDYNTSAIDEITNDPVVPAKHLRAPGPIRRAVSFWRGGKGLLLLLAPVVMDPGVRRDDGGESIMTDKAAEKLLKASGWTIVETTGFVHLIGPLWQRVVNGEHEYALVAQDKHHNRRGLVQGGVLMTFADRTCGMTARYVSGKPTLATVQMDVHFVDSGKIGEILMSKPRVVRTTRSLIFVGTEVTAEKRCIAMASGVFKILKNEA
jgi:acyl-coenzyme A thioesterase PaaI-like protein